MDKLKFGLLAIVVLSLLGLLGYWAVSTIQSGTEYQASQELKDLRKENEELRTEVAGLTEEVASLQAQVKENLPDTTSEPEQPTNVPATKPSVTYKYQTQINELQKLVDGNVLMKLGSSGTRVGTVQKFLNTYNGTSNRVDNDYGEATEKAVATFQKEQGLTADGQAGAGTFSKMISWLKKQG